MTDDRRRHPRYSAEGLHGTYRRDSSFVVVKISLGGMLVTLDEEAALDDLVPISLELGQDVFRSNARVVFVGPDTAREQGYRVGFAFEQTAPAEQLRLERYLRREFE